MNFYSFTPYDARGLGHAYNAACAIVPHADDWIVLQDADIMLLPGDWGTQVGAALTQHPQYEVFVCLATRTWRKGDQGDQQLTAPAGVRTERDLLKLFHVAQSRAQSHWACVVPWPGVRAPSGFWLAFRRRVWDAVKFPLIGPQGSPRLGIDTAWFRELMQRGTPIGLLTGLVAIHFYRLDRPDESAGYLLDKSAITASVPPAHTCKPTSAGRAAGNIP